MRILAVLFVLMLGACGLLPENKDETEKWSADKLYTEAKDAMTDGAYDKAVKYFEKLESRYPYGRYAQQSQLEVAYAYFKQSETASAIAACDRFIRLHPNHPNVDYAYYLKGLANFNEDLGILGAIASQDQTERDPKSARESFDTFKELVTRFPTSRYAEDSRARMRYLVNALAAGEVHVARYYYKRGAYLAAANRAQTVIQTYPGTPSQEDALEVLAKSYDALGIKDLRDDAARVLKATQAKKPAMVASADADSGKPWWKFWPEASTSPEPATAKPWWKIW